MTFEELGGHNRPDYATEIQDRLPKDFDHFVADVDAAERAASQLPDTITTREDHDTAVDLAARIRGIDKNIEATRVDEKNPFLQAERAVDGFFNPLRKRLEKLAGTRSSLINSKVTDYLNAVAAEERRKREEAERKEREAAEAARLKQEEAERKAEEARRADYREKHNKAADDAAFKAQAHEEKADRAATMAQEAPADLARTRTDRGTLSTLKTEWVGVVDDWDQVPIEKLRAYIPVPVLEKALAAFIRNGGRQLKGARIYETNRAMVR